MSSHTPVYNSAEQRPAAMERTSKGFKGNTPSVQPSKNEARYRAIPEKVWRFAASRERLAGLRPGVSSHVGGVWAVPVH